MGDTYPMQIPPELVRYQDAVKHGSCCGKLFYDAIRSPALQLSRQYHSRLPK